MMTPFLYGHKGVRPKISAILFSLSGSWCLEAERLFVVDRPKQLTPNRGDGSQTRPIGIPTFEDKVLQRAVAMVLEAVY